VFFHEIFHHTNKFIRPIFFGNERRQTMVKRCFLIVLILTAFMATTVAAKPIAIGSSNPGSITHSYSAAVAKLITDQLKMQTRVIPHGGQSAFIPAVNAGEVDFGIGSSFEVVDGVAGKGIYEGQVLKDLRVVAVLAPLKVAFFVANDSPIKSIKDLKGKKVPGGWTSQKIVRYLTAAIFANAGLTYDDVEMVPVPNVNRGAEDFMQGKVDTFYFAVGSALVREAGAKVGGVRALPFDPSPEAVARARKHLVVMYPLLVQPSDANYGIVGPTYVAATDFLIITNKNVPEDLVYKVTKALHGGKNAFMASFKPLGINFSPDKMAKRLPAGEYHPGAIRFYKEVGLWPPKE
jgi:TRAP transporter TAXI family solute receptor